MEFIDDSAGVVMCHEELTDYRTGFIFARVVSYLFTISFELPADVLAALRVHLLDLGIRGLEVTLNVLPVSLTDDDLVQPTLAVRADHQAHNRYGGVKSGMEGIFVRPPLRADGTPNAPSTTSSSSSFSSTDAPGVAAEEGVSVTDIPPETQPENITEQPVSLLHPSPGPSLSFMDNRVPAATVSSPSRGGETADDGAQEPTANEQCIYKEMQRAALKLRDRRDFNQLGLH